MFNRLRKIFLISIIFAIVGCSPIYTQNFQYTSPHSEGGKSCAARCLKTKNLCEQMYAMRHNMCHIRAQDIFDCVPTYNKCYENCGGKVYEQRVCLAFCNRKNS